MNDGAGERDSCRAEGGDGLMKERQKKRHRWFSAAETEVGVGRGGKERRGEKGRGGREGERRREERRGERANTSNCWNAEATHCKREGEACVCVCACLGVSGFYGGDSVIS